MKTAEVVGLQEALDNVADLALAEPEIEASLSVASRAFMDNPSERREQVQHEFLILLGTILNRAEAIGAESLEELLGIYLEVERGHCLSRLTGDLVVPLVMAAFPSTLDVVHLSDTVSVERLDEASQRSRAPNSEYTSTGQNPYHRAAATHAVVVRGVTVPNLFRRMLRRDLDNLDLSAVDTVVEVLSILADDDQVGYFDVLMRPHGWATGWVGELAALERVATLDRLPVPGSAVWQDPKQEYPQKLIEKLPRAFERLSAAQDKTRIASRRVVRATLRQEQEDSFLDSMIGIEALLGRERDEITHRLALRAAVVLAEKWAPTEVFGLVKFLYAQRSSIVHGVGRPKTSVDFAGDTYQTVQLGPWLLRELFVDWLESPLAWTPQSLDQRLLEGLTRTPLAREEPDHA